MNVPPRLIGIEAGMATHYMSRELLALGHEVKQVPAAAQETGMRSVDQNAKATK